jgi:hypothetical protein
MNSGVVNRPLEFRAVTQFLQSAGAQPSGLIIEGEAGIGKTTLWLSGVEQACARGFRVLSARVGEAESVLAYAAVADLLGDVDSTVLADLSDAQRIAVDRVLLRASPDGPTTDQRVVAAAFATVVDRLSAEAPVLVAIDDVQCLDPSGQAVVEYAARRLRGRAGMLLTERCDPNQGRTVTWLHLARPEGIERIRLGPFSLGGLHALISTSMLGAPVSLIVFALRRDWIMMSAAAAVTQTLLSAWHVSTPISLRCKTLHPRKPI